MFDIVTEDAILSGRATDAYFDRTVAALESAGRDPEVVAEVTASQFPSGDHRLLAGVREAAQLLAAVDAPLDVDGLVPGRLFDGGPVMRVRGNYRAFARYETSLLGFLSHASGIATAALEARVAAPDSTVLSFGARHVHPSVAAVVERSALLAGLDGFSHVAAGELIGREAGGTMPHALVLCFGPGNQEAAWRAFDEAAPEGTPRIALVDTFTDETDEARRAAEAIDLDGVRVDTTGSRRGDLRHILREVRWKLDEAGHEDVELFVSGGLGPAQLRALRDVADGFGVGSHVSNADPLDFALDIVEVDGEATGKRGKLSGVKDVYRLPDGSHRVVPAGEPVPDGEALLEPLVRDGELVADLGLKVAAERTRRERAELGFGADE
jgi:nicotinate phosphoribosyltransferase